MARQLNFFVLSAVLLMPVAAYEQEMALDYQARYICQSGEPDHLLDAIGINGNRALVAGNRGLALIDLAALPPDGTRNYIDRLPGLNARNLYLKDNTYIYVNLNRGENSSSPGFAVVRLNENSLQYITTVDEPGTLYEKMCIADDWLYVAAHSKGIRIYSLIDPENPELMGSLDEGFTDAWAIDVDGNIAFVADGGGGLKIVDVSDNANPVLMAGENPETSMGTSEDVFSLNGYVYVAAGGAGVAVYQSDDISSRFIVEIGICAKDICKVGDYLAVANIGGFVVLDVNDPDQISIVAREIAARRGSSGILRICSAVGFSGSNSILAANWNFVDVYELKNADSSNQPDINCSHQRVRFPPGGGIQTVTVYNNGRGLLDISGVSSSQNSFVVDYSGGTLLPGEIADFDITYDGSSNGIGVIRIHSNDPDENPLPIQVFGRTQFLDPGEPAVDFSLPVLRKDPQSGEYIEEIFTLSEHSGKVIWFQVYGSW